MGGGERAREPRKDYYKNQGGWDEFTWGGVVRSAFVFSDSLQAGGCLSTGAGEGTDTIFTAAQVAEHLPNRYFAGIVCVAD